jgi:plasmid stabilization system protein ParE
MKKIYDVVWSATSEKDLRGILEYIAADSPSNAFEIFNEIKQKTSRLYAFPERGRIVPELKDQGIVLYRELIVPPWRIIYRISKKTVYVLSVLDSRQNVEDILLRRLIRPKS